VRENWRLPSEGGIQVVVERCAGHPLCSTDDVCDLHKVVVYDIREVVCRRTIRLHQNGVGGVKRTLVISSSTCGRTALQAFDIAIDEVRVCAFVDILRLLKTDCEGFTARFCSLGSL
jgi:hypothetical protein